MFSCLLLVCKPYYLCVNVHVCRVWFEKENCSKEYVVGKENWRRRILLLLLLTCLDVFRFVYWWNHDGDLIKEENTRLWVDSPFGSVWVRKRETETDICLFTLYSE